MKPAGSEAKCRSRPGRRRANGPAPGAGRNKEKKKKEDELRTRDATNNKKIGIGETKTPSKPTAECMNRDLGWQTRTGGGEVKPSVTLAGSHPSTPSSSATPKCRSTTETAKMWKPCIEGIYPEPGGTLSGNTLNNALNLQNQYHSKIGGPPPPPPPPPPRVPRKGPSRKAKRRAHRFPQEQTQQKEEECATTQEARESQDQERPQWVDDPVWALYRNRKGDETKVYAAMVKCPAPELWITYEDDGSWERIRDENRVRARRPEEETPPPPWDTGPFVSCIFNDRPDRLLPVQFQPKHHKPPSIHEEGRPQFGREEGDFVCHFGARSPRPKTPRKTPTEGADTSMGVDDPETLQQEKGEEGIRKRQRAQTPRQSMGPSPSPDLPRKTRRQESPVPQEEWPPLRRGGDSTSPDSGTVPNTEKSPNLERTEQESRTTGETPIRKC